MLRFFRGHEPQKVKTPQQRMAARRQRLRAQGCGPCSIGCREVKLMAQHPENTAIDDWTEQVYDWESWK
jgi:hypothetical protein